MPIEVRHDPPILFPMLAQLANTAMLGASEAEIARKQADAQRRQGLYDSIGRVIGAPIEGFFKGLQQRLLYDLSLERDAEEHRQRLETIALNNQSEENQQYRKLMLDAGYVPNFDDPGLQHTNTKIDAEMQKLHNAFAAGDITQEQYDAGIQPLHRQRVMATLNAPFIKKPPDNPAWMQEIVDKGFYELNDGTRLFQASPGRISYIPPQKKAAETRTDRPIDLAELSAASKQLADETGLPPSPQQAAERAVRNRMAVQQANLMMQSQLLPGFQVYSPQAAPSQPESLESQLKQRIIKYEGQNYLVDQDARGNLTNIRPLPQQAAKTDDSSDTIAEMIRREYKEALAEHRKSADDPVLKLTGENPPPPPDIREIAQMVIDRENAIQREIQRKTKPAPSEASQIPSGAPQIPAEASQIPSGASQILSDDEVQKQRFYLRVAAITYGHPSRWPPEVARYHAPSTERLLETLMHEIDNPSGPIDAEKQADLRKQIRMCVDIIERAQSAHIERAED